MHRGLFWFLPALFAVLILCVLGHMTIFEQWKVQHDKQLRRAEILEEVLRLQRLVLDVETSFRGYLLAGQRFFLEPLQTADGQLAAIAKRLIALTEQDQSLRAGVDLLQSRLKEFINSKNSLTAIADNGQMDQVHLYVRVGDGRALFLTIDKAFKDFENRIDREFPLDDTLAEGWAVRAVWQLFLFDTAGIFASVALTRAFLVASRQPSPPFVGPYKPTVK
jgi:CHASE3 domain sensor protein